MRFFLLSASILHLCLAQNPGKYTIELLRSEDATSSPLFSIAKAAPFDGGLRLFINTSRPDTVAGLLAAGALEAQLSDHQRETAATVSLYLGKAVWCSQDAEPIYLRYADPLPDCGGKPPVRVEFFFEVPVTLGPGRDLAIGQEPDFLWLIEER
ncbi:MAG TPA: hypothetical protein VE398_11175 [Acidobacteriota bacterium]|nr:hypothetical protein [Acidobacteriota bacterium]